MLYNARRRLRDCVEVRASTNLVKWVALRDCMTSGGTLVEFGAGFGADVRKWINVGATRVVAVDIAESGLEELMKRVDDARITVTPVLHDFTSPLLFQHLPEGVVGHVDMVAAGLSIHYSCSSVDSAYNALHNMYSLLRSGGYAFVSVPHDATIVLLLRIQWLCFTTGCGREKSKSALLDAHGDVSRALSQLGGCTPLPTEEAELAERAGTDVETVASVTCVHHLGWIFGEPGMYTISFVRYLEKSGVDAGAPPVFTENDGFGVPYDFKLSTLDAIPEMLLPPKFWDMAREIGFVLKPLVASVGLPARPINLNHFLEVYGPYIQGLLADFKVIGKHGHMPSPAFNTTALYSAALLYKR